MTLTIYDTPLEEHEAALQRDIEKAPKNLDCRYQLAKHYFRLARWEELERLIGEVRRIEGAPAPQRARVMMFKLLADYIAGRFGDQALYREVGEGLAAGYAADPALYKPDVTYHKFLVKLYQYRTLNPDHFNPVGECAVHAVGDSHCLSAHRLRTKQGTCKAHLLTGMTAANLQKGGSDRRLFYMQRALERIPEGAVILLTAGEIDCRVEYGIVPRALEANVPVPELARKTASDYVECLSGNRHRLLFATVPPIAPARILEAKDKDADFRAKIMLVRDAIVHFNDALRTSCAARGQGVLDLYQQAVGQNGLAVMDAHIDTVHLNPHVVQQAIDRSLNQ